MAMDNNTFKVAAGLFCAVVSVGTALAFAFAWILPDTKSMHSPRERQIELENAVALRTQELNKLVREVQHQLVNQLQVLSSAINLEERKEPSEQTTAVLDRLRALLKNIRRTTESARKNITLPSQYIGPDFGFERYLIGETTSNE